MLPIIKGKSKWLLENSFFFLKTKELVFWCPSSKKITFDYRDSAVVKNNRYAHQWYHLQWSRGCNLSSRMPSLLPHPNVRKNRLGYKWHILFLCKPRSILICLVNFPPFLKRFPLDKILWAPSEFLR